ncbi:AQJ64_40280 family protein [Streptomyces sp. NPDC006638]|uniref:AQJ64_40280 family protein n=1 Tax=Streptomyces sp. NPDC006638 TaxID=3157183 RepID=UPI0033B30FA2
MHTVEVEWVSALDRLPKDSDCVMGAITGRYPGDPEGEDADSRAGEEYWLVLPTYFHSRHTDERTGTLFHNCFVDSDRVVRLPYGGSTPEQVTHWAELPVLPGTSKRQILGAGAQPALHAALPQAPGVKPDEREAP